MRLLLRRYAFFTLIFFLAAFAGGCGGSGESGPISFNMPEGALMSGRAFAKAPVVGGEIRLTAGDAVLAVSEQPTSNAGTYALDLSNVTIPAVRYGILECRGGTVSGDRVDIILSAPVDLQKLNGVKSSHKHISFLSSIVNTYMGDGKYDYETAKKFVVAALGLGSDEGLEDGNVVVRPYFSDEVFEKALIDGNIDTPEKFSAFISGILSRYARTGEETIFAKPANSVGSTAESAASIREFAAKTGIKKTIAHLLDELVSPAAGSVFTKANLVFSGIKVIVKIVADGDAFESYLADLKEIDYAAESMAADLFFKANEIHEMNEETLEAISELETALDAAIFASEMNLILPDINRITSADEEFIQILSSDLCPAYDIVAKAYKASCDAGAASADAAEYAVTLIPDDARDVAGKFMERIWKSANAGGYDINQSLYNIHSEIVGSGVGSKGLLRGITDILVDKMRRDIEENAEKDPYFYYLTLEAYWSYLLSIQFEGYLLEMNYLSTKGAEAYEKYAVEMLERQKAQSVEFLRCAAQLAMETASLSESSVIYNRGGSDWERLYGTGESPTIIHHNAVESCSGVGTDPGNREYYQEFVGFLDRAYFYTALLSTKGDDAEIPMGAAFVYMSTESSVRKAVKAAKEGSLIFDGNQRRAFSPIKFNDGKEYTTLRSKQNFINWFYDKTDETGDLLGVFSDTMSAAIFATYPTDEDKNKFDKEEIKQGHYVGAGVGNYVLLDGNKVMGWIYSPKQEIFLDMPITYALYYRPDTFLNYASADASPGSEDKYLCDLTARIDLLPPPGNIMDYFPTSLNIKRIDSAIEADYDANYLYHKSFERELGGFSLDDGVSRRNPPNPDANDPPFGELNMVQAQESRVRVVSDPNSHVRLEGGIDFLFDFDYMISIPDIYSTSSEEVAYSYRVGAAKKYEPNSETDISSGWEHEIVTQRGMRITDRAFYGLGDDSMLGHAWAAHTDMIMPTMTVRASGRGLNYSQGDIRILTEIAYKYMAVRPYVE